MDKELFKMTCPMSKVLGKSKSSNYNNNIISKYLLNIAPYPLNNALQNFLEKKKASPKKKWLTKRL